MDCKILDALQEKEIFIGYLMLCRYLNGKGYIRYGCNAGYKKPFTNGKDRLNPCPIKCPDSKIYHSKVRYYCIKLKNKGLLYLEKIQFYDSKNPRSKNKPHKLDIFTIIARSEAIFNEWRSKHNLI